MLVLNYRQVDAERATGCMLLPNVGGFGVDLVNEHIWSAPAPIVPRATLEAAI
jgi:hypothetical protein